MNNFGSQEDISVSDPLRYLHCITANTKVKRTTLERKIKVTFKCAKTQEINLMIRKQDCEEKWRTVKNEDRC